MSSPPKQLNEKELKALGEIHIEINWKGLWKAWRMVFEKAPLSAYQKVTRKAEGLSRKMMTGRLAFPGMLAGIILRNTSRSMHNSSEGRYLASAEVVGVLAAVGVVGAVTWFGGPVAFAWLAAKGAMAGGFVGSVAAGNIGWFLGYVGALMGGLLASVPAYTAGTLICSTAIGAAVAVFSTCISAPVNVPTSLKRAGAAWKGIKMTEGELEAIQTEFDKDSPSVRYERARVQSARDAFNGLSEDNQKKVFEEFKKQFEAAAAKEEAGNKPAAALAPKA